MDDDTDSLSALAIVLEMEGATVAKAGSGPEALAALKAERFDVLLSDIGMAGMSGIELIREVRKLASAGALHSVAISGYGRDADVTQALQAGFDAHLTKPVSLDRLYATLAKFDKA